MVTAKDDCNDTLLGVFWDIVNPISDSIKY